MGHFLAGNGRAVSVLEVPAAGLSNFVVITPEITGADEDEAKLREISPELVSHVRALRNIVNADKSSLFFVNTRRVSGALGSVFHESEVGIHHGAVAKKAR